MKILKNKMFLYILIAIAFFILETILLIYKPNLWYKILIVVNAFLGCHASSRMGKKAANGHMGFEIAMGLNPLTNIWKQIIKNSLICLLINMYSLFMRLGFDVTNYEKHLFIFVSMFLIGIFTSFLNYLLAGFLKTIYISEIFVFFVVAFFGIAFFMQDFIFDWFKFNNKLFNNQDKINHYILWGSFIGFMILFTPLFYFYRYSRWNNIKPDFKEASSST